MTIWSDEPPTEAGWYWVLCDGMPRVARWNLCDLDINGRRFANVRHDHPGRFKFGPRIPSAEELAYQQFIMELLRFTAGRDSTDMIFWHVSDRMRITPCVRCNDCFHYASADCESILPEQFDTFKAAFTDMDAVDADLSEIYAGMLFVARVRKMRPLRAKYPDNLVTLFDACGPEREGSAGKPIKITEAFMIAADIEANTPIGIGQVIPSAEELVELQRKAALWDESQLPTGELLPSIPFNVVSRNTVTLSRVENMPITPIDDPPEQSDFFPPEKR